MVVVEAVAGIVVMTVVEAATTFSVPRVTFHFLQEILVAARREVVLSAGALGSPHLLLLSGVGPRQHLQQHKVRRRYQVLG